MLALDRGTVVSSLLDSIRLGHTFPYGASSFQQETTSPSAFIDLSTTLSKTHFFHYLPVDFLAKSQVTVEGFVAKA